MLLAKLEQPMAESYRSASLMMQAVVLRDELVMSTLLSQGHHTQARQVGARDTTGRRL